MNFTIELFCFFFFIKLYSTFTMWMCYCSVVLQYVLELNALS